MGLLPQWRVGYCVADHPHPHFNWRHTVSLIFADTHLWEMLTSLRCIAAGAGHSLGGWLGWNDVVGTKTNVTQGSEYRARTIMPMIDHRDRVQPLFEITLACAARPASHRSSVPVMLARVTQCAAQGFCGFTRHVAVFCGRTHPSDIAFVREAAAALCELVTAINESEATGAARRAEDALRREAQTAIDWIAGHGTRVRPDMANRLARRIREVASLVAITGHAEGTEHAGRLRRLVACGYGRDARDWRKIAVN